MEGCALPDREAVPGPEDLCRGPEGAEGGPRADAHGPGLLLEGPQATDLGESLCPGCPAAGDRRFREGFGGLREPDGGRRPGLPPPGAVALTGRDRPTMSRVRRIARRPHG